MNEAGEGAYRPVNGCRTWKSPASGQSRPPKREPMQNKQGAKYE